MRCLGCRVDGVVPGDNWALEAERVSASGATELLLPQHTFRWVLTNNDGVGGVLKKSLCLAVVSGRRYRGTEVEWGMAEMRCPDCLARLETD